MWKAAALGPGTFSVPLFNVKISMGFTIHHCSDCQWFIFDMYTSSRQSSACDHRFLNPKMRGEKETSDFPVQIGREYIFTEYSPSAAKAHREKGQSFWCFIGFSVKSQRARCSLSPARLEVNPVACVILRAYSI